MSHNNGLQALRGLAALLVFFQHVLWMAGFLSGQDISLYGSVGLPQAGVYMFFGLSGYLMLTRLGQSRWKFFRDRVRRIYPTYLLVALLALALNALLFQSSFDVSIENLLLLPSSTPSTALRIPYWSLVFEVFFYAVVLLALKLPRPLVAALLGAWAAAILVWHQAPLSNFLAIAYPSWTELPLNLLNLFFIAGAAAALLPRPALPWWLAALASMASLVVSAAVLPPLGLGSGAAWLLAVAVWLGVSAALDCTAAGPVGRLLRWIGDLSYGIYLAHLLGVYLADQLLWRLGLPFALTLPLVALIAALPALGVGWLDLRLQVALKRTAPPVATAAPGGEVR